MTHSLPHPLTSPSIDALALPSTTGGLGDNPAIFNGRNVSTGSESESSIKSTTISASVLTTSTPSTERQKELFRAKYNIREANIECRKRRDEHDRFAASLKGPESIQHADICFISREINRLSDDPALDFLSPKFNINLFIETMSRVDEFRSFRNINADILKRPRTKVVTPEMYQDLVAECKRQLEEATPRLKSNLSEYETMNRDAVVDFIFDEVRRISSNPVFDLKSSEFDSDKFYNALDSTPEFRAFREVYSDFLLWLRLDSY